MTKHSLHQGTLDLIVLNVLSTESLHGYAIAQKIRDKSADRLTDEEGSLYPALYRMERKGWIRSRWQNTEKQRRARIYALTKAGRERLAEEEENWSAVSGVTDAILKLT
jgi:transcriptional regulator